MKRCSILWIALLLLFPVGMKGQEVVTRWTLQDCLEYALENNIQIRKTIVTQLSGVEDLKQARAQLFPSASASVTQGFVNYPSRNADRNNSYSGSYNVNANWQLFDGGRRVTNIKQQEIQEEVNYLGTEESENDIRIAIVQSYMQVLYAMEAIRINESTVEVSRAQRDRSGQLLLAGSISRVELAQMESQLSQDEYQLVVARTNLENYKLQLKQLLELDIMEEIELVMPEITEEDILKPLPDKATVYQITLNTMPQIRSSELNVDIAELDIKRARAGYYPSISMNASIGTNHLTGSNYNWGNQVWNGFNENIGLTLSIPIYSNRENKTAVNKAKLAVINSRLDLLNERKNLLMAVEGVYLDALSAQNQYMAAVDQVEAIEESYTLTEAQFNLGMKNTIELLTEKNNYLIAQQQELQAKYLAIISIQLLNIYQNLPVDPNY